MGCRVAGLLGWADWAFQGAPRDCMECAHLTEPPNWDQPRVPSGERFVYPKVCAKGREQPFSKLRLAPRCAAFLGGIATEPWPCATKRRLRV